MKNQAILSLKDKSKKLKCHLLQFLFGFLRVNSGPLIDPFGSTDGSTDFHIFTWTGNIAMWWEPKPLEEKSFL